MGAPVRELFMYACQPCGTVRVTPRKMIAGETVACPACHHVTVPIAVAVDFFEQKFVTPDDPNITRRG